MKNTLTFELFPNPNSLISVWGGGTCLSFTEGVDGEAVRINLSTKQAEYLFTKLGQDLGHFDRRD